MGWFTKAENTEPVSVTIKRPWTRQGFDSLLDVWAEKYPEAEVQSLYGHYGDVTVILRLPMGTTVQVPALIDATASEDAGSTEQQAD